MLAPDVIEATAIRQTLLTLPDVQALVAWAEYPGEYKIFSRFVDKGVSHPYIVIYPLMGGLTRDQRHTDTWYRVVGHSATHQTAQDLKNAISELREVWPDVTGLDNVCPITQLEISFPIDDVYAVQNTPFFVEGIIVRIQLDLESS